MPPATSLSLSQAEKLLGGGPITDLKQLKKAFRKAAMRTHPDKFPHYNDAQKEQKKRDFQVVCDAAELVERVLGGGRGKRRGMGDGDPGQGNAGGEDNGGGEGEGKEDSQGSNGTGAYYDPEDWAGLGTKWAKPKDPNSKPIFEEAGDSDDSDVRVVDTSRYSIDPQPQAGGSRWLGKWGSGNAGNGANESAVGMVGIRNMFKTKTTWKLSRDKEGKRDCVIS
jgi:hypothetical protein